MISGYKRSEKGTLTRFLEKVSGYSKQQLTRMIKRYTEEESLVEERSTESNEYSWSVLNGFMIALGVGAVTTALIALSGASWIIAASIGIGVGIGAMLTYGLFQYTSEAKQDLPNQFMPSVA